MTYDLVWLRYDQLAGGPYYASQMQVAQRRWCAFSSSRSRQPEVLQPSFQVQYLRAGTVGRPPERWVMKPSSLSLMPHAGHHMPGSTGEGKLGLAGCHSTIAGRMESEVDKGNPWTQPVCPDIPSVRRDRANGPCFTPTVKAPRDVPAHVRQAGSCALHPAAGSRHPSLPRRKVGHDADTTAPARTGSARGATRRPPSARVLGVMADPSASVMVSSI